MNNKYVFIVIKHYEIAMYENGKKFENKKNTLIHKKCAIFHEFNVSHLRPFYRPNHEYLTKVFRLTLEFIHLTENVFFFQKSTSE